MSHDETARKSAAGENCRSDMLSSGGDVSGTSFETSPVEPLEAFVVAAVEPKRFDILWEGGREVGDTDEEFRR